MLCTVADVEAILQTDITNDTDPRIIVPIELAGFELEAAIGRTMEAETGLVLTLTASPWRADVLLDRWPLAAVNSVTEDGTALVAGTDYRADLERGILTRLSGGVPAPWTSTVDAIVVDVDTLTPGDLRGACARLAANAFEAGLAIANRPDALNGLRQLTIGRWSATAETGQRSRPGITLDEDAVRVTRRWQDRRP